MRVRNNCGIHTIFYIMGHCRSGIELSMSPSQIETHSIQIRAWLIKMIVEGLPEGMPWAHSLKDHLRRNMEVNKWFQPENFVQFRNSPLLAAISTLFPDQYVAGDALQLAIKSLNLTIGPDSYLTDVLLSHLPTDGMLRTIKKQMQRSPSKKVFNKILIPINVTSTHWYLGDNRRANTSYRHTTTV